MDRGRETRPGDVTWELITLELPCCSRSEFSDDVKIQGELNQVEKVGFLDIGRRKSSPPLGSASGTEG